MPNDSWGAAPTVQPHAGGFSIPVAVVETQVAADGDMPAYSHWDGIRVEVRSLASVDVTAGVTNDPDATDDNLIEALALALDASAPNVQPQIDELMLMALGG